MLTKNQKRGRRRKKKSGPMESQGQLRDLEDDRLWRGKAAPFDVGGLQVTYWDTP